MIQYERHYILNLSYYTATQIIDKPNSNKMTKKSTSKRVQFGAANITHTLPEQNDDAKDLLWYNGAMYQENIQRLSATSNDAANNEDDDDELSCSCLTSERRLRRQNHSRSVLSMQGEIHANVTAGTDVTGLRAFAAASSKMDALRGRERATQCAKEAFEAYNETTPWMKAAGMTAQDYASHSTSRTCRRRGVVRANKQSSAVLTAHPLLSQALTKEAMRIMWAL